MFVQFHKWNMDMDEQIYTQPSHNMFILHALCKEYIQIGQTDNIIHTKFPENSLSYKCNYNQLPGDLSE